MTHLSNFTSGSFKIWYDDVDMGPFSHTNKKNRQAKFVAPSLGHRPKGGILATGGSKRCITVSTLAEAEFYADAGFEVHVTFCFETA